jgi:Uma2 family endonuclease
MTTMPLGVIEIISPSQGDQELVDKIDRYFDLGVRSCWLVHPTFRMVSIFTNKGLFRNVTDGELHDTILDLRVNLADLFR